MHDASLLTKVDATARLAFTNHSMYQPACPASRKMAINTGSASISG
jgi:hypothetical protein